MHITKKIYKFSTALFLGCVLNFLYVATAWAICPVCTIAVGAGIGLAQWMGIDDSITGLWVGGFIVSLILWTINWLNKKNIRFPVPGRAILVVVGYYALVIIPLYLKGIMGHALNTMWGIDKLLLGIILGSVVFLIGGCWYGYLKRKNNNHAYFPFQKVVMPIAPLIILSIIFYFLTK
jgi:hypothetical protein